MSCKIELRDGWREMANVWQEYGSSSSEETEVGDPHGNHNLKDLYIHTTPKTNEAFPRVIEQ